MQTIIISTPDNHSYFHDTWLKSLDVAKRDLRDAGIALELDYSKAAKRMAEQIDAEYLQEQLERDASINFTGSGASTWSTLTFNLPEDSKVTRSYGDNAVYTTIIFDELEPVKKEIRDSKLRCSLERNYELARIRHDVKLMKRLEKQMHANYK